MSQSRFTKTLATLTKRMKWPENKSIGYEGPDKRDKYLNPLLTPPPRNPTTQEDYQYPDKMGHWNSKSFDWSNPVADKYYYHESFFIVMLGFVYGLWVWYRNSKNVVTTTTQETEEQKSLLHDLELKLYNVLPLRATSSLWGKINSYNLPVWMRSRLYDYFCRTYNCDMSEALEADYRNYKNLSEFFSRRLKPEARPISSEPGVVSPADGLILHFGPILDGRIEGVKGLNYSVQAFLGLSAPGDYHRFHSPANWIVNYRKHFPGRLLSVRPSLMKRMPEVLHINERVCYEGSWEHGFFSMTAVGATNVGSIKVEFDEDLRTNRRHLWRPDRYACFEHKFDKDVELKAGQDFGEFNFGSTIVLIFEAPKNSTFEVKDNQRIKYGQLMAKIASPVHQPSTKSKD